MRERIVSSLCLGSLRLRLRRCPRDACTRGWVSGRPVSPDSNSPDRCRYRCLPDMATDAGACIICLDTSPPPIQSGCACRGHGGLAHVDCLVQLAASQQAHRGASVWRQWRTCEQDFTGAMEIGLAEAWWSRVAGLAAESLERLAAEANLAKALVHQG